MHNIRFTFPAGIKKAPFALCKRGGLLITWRSLALFQTLEFNLSQLFTVYVIAFDRWRLM
ncbi:hypothetical protein N018_26070 (plasmid) [Pseudomonas syringae CC1557]|uniref:Uncharacterized protein n=1 Tax=Pseudomonas syringae CC1557 TaxID=1357279 RepID=W0MZ75_PSESX|nr:hypothetical protein N018_26070 [Pseudomonas syringae CC1557]